MSVIAEFRVQSPDLVLEQALSSVPEMKLELVQEVGTDPEQPYLSLWARGGDFERFEAAMADDPTVTDVQQYVSSSERVLYRVRATAATEVVIYPVWVELGAEQLEVRYVDGWWDNRMRFPDREALAEAREWCEDVGVSFEVDRVYTDDTARDESGLTDAQREALAVAFETGYFEVPRETSIDDVATELGISSQSVSERLRRGHRTLVARHVSSSNRP